jgi:hypothetical protein
MDEASSYIFIFFFFCMTRRRIHVNYSVAIKYKSLYTRGSFPFYRKVSKEFVF